MNKIKMYSLPGCIYCQKAKEYFDKSGIEFEEINISEDEKAAREMIEKSGQSGVPVIQIGRVIVVGFDKAKIEKLLKQN